MVDFGSDKSKVASTEESAPLPDQSDFSWVSISLMTDYKVCPDLLDGWKELVESAHTFLRSPDVERFVEASKPIVNLHTLLGEGLSSFGVLRLVVVSKNNPNYNLSDEDNLKFEKDRLDRATDRVTVLRDAVEILSKSTPEELLIHLRNLAQLSRQFERFLSTIVISLQNLSTRNP